MLTAPWWPGVAGIVQVIAVLLSLGALWQATRLIRQVERTRLETTSPIWKMLGLDYWLDDPSRVSVVFSNIGSGAAKDTYATFEPANGVKPQSIIAGGRRGNGRVIPTNDILTVTLVLDNMQHLDGTLIVSSKTRSGRSISKFHLTTLTHGNRVTHSEVRPVD